MRIDNILINNNNNRFKPLPGTQIQYDSYQGDVSTAGGGTYAGPVYTDKYTGMRMTDGTFQGSRMIYWVCNDFDFMADWRMSCQVYIGTISGQTLGDGFMMCVGGANGTVISGESPTTPYANGALKARYYTYYNTVGTPRGFTILNSTTVIGNSQGSEVVNDAWVYMALEVRTSKFDSKKRAVLSIKTGDASILFSRAGADVTSWVNGGTYVYLNAGTGAASQNTYVRDIRLEYI